MSCQGGHPQPCLSSIILSPLNGNVKMSPHETGDIHVESEGTAQRVSVISACIKGDMACARAAGLLCLSVRQIKRLKKRMREDGEAALAHANPGRPSHRPLPHAVRERIGPLSRGTYPRFNHHHSCEKLVGCEGIPLSRRTPR